MGICVRIVALLVSADCKNSSKSRIYNQLPGEFNLLRFISLFFFSMYLVLLLFTRDVVTSVLKVISATNQNNLTEKYSFAGTTRKRKVCNIYGTQGRRTSLRSSWRHSWSEVKDGYDRVCLPHDKRLPATEEVTLNFTRWLIDKSFSCSFCTA